MVIARVRRLPSLLLVACLGLPGAAHAALPTVPEGFEIRLLAAVPAVEYPCQVATAPDGSLFVAEDPMDQVGPYNKPIDRILLFRDGCEPISCVVLDEHRHVVPDAAGEFRVRETHCGLDDFRAKLWKALGQTGANFLDLFDLVRPIHAQSVH